MPLETIYVVRHGFRTSWSVDHVTGTYSSSFPSPTGIPVDPALTAHGVEQSIELGHYLANLDPPVEAVYSSPYFRCLQTVTPFVGLQQKRWTHQRDEPQSEAQHLEARHGESIVGRTSTPLQDTAATTIRPEHGLCDWFGSAPFEHPGPASSSVLKSWFPAYDDGYVSAQYPPKRGESLVQLQSRITATLQAIVERCDAEDRRAVVLCTHAAVIIMLGRILTGAFPESVDVDDFRAFTCGLSVYRRRNLDKVVAERRESTSADAGSGPVVGQWVCEANSDCSFLRLGEERGWRFTGDEEFPGTESMSLPITDYKL